MGIISKNRKAFFDYSVLDTYIAGIKLLGSEVKSIRINCLSISDSYGFIEDGEIFIKGMNIPQLKTSEYDNHEPTRVRKLLLNKKEINKISMDVSTDRLTIIPLEIILNENNFIKVKIGICRGKKAYDKSKAIKERDINREIKNF
jgi:SsrA-binding protein